LSNQTADFVRQGGSGIHQPFETHQRQPGSDPWTREEIVDVGDRAALEAARLGSPGRWHHPDGHIYEVWHFRDPFTGRQTGQWTVTGVTEEAPRPASESYFRGDLGGWHDGPYTEVSPFSPDAKTSMSIGSVTCSSKG
jgi:hypothetical protein